MAKSAIKCTDIYIQPTYKVYVDESLSFMTGHVARPSTMQLYSLLIDDQETINA